jgi:cell division protein FtsZ
MKVKMMNEYAEEIFDKMANCAPFKNYLPEPMIACVGIGGGGCNITSKLERKLPGVKMFCLNTDDISNVKRDGVTSYTFGKNITVNNRDSGGYLKVGKKAMKDDFPVIYDNIIENADLLIIVSSLGGGTGSGGTIEMVRKCNEYSKPYRLYTIKPFEFEDNRKEIADRAMEEIKKDARNLVIFDNNEFDGINDANNYISEEINKFVKEAHKRLVKIYFDGFIKVLQSAAEKVFPDKEYELILSKEKEIEHPSDDIALELSIRTDGPVGTGDFIG